MAQVRALGASLENANTAALAAAPPSVVAVLSAVGDAPLHVALLVRLLEDIQWPDAQLLSQHLLQGFPLVGDIPISHLAKLDVIRPLVQPADELLLRGSQLRTDLLARAARPPARGDQAAGAREVFNQTLKEVSLGRISGLAPLQEQYSGLPITRRFPAEQIGPSGAKKIRPIDDFKESQVNDACIIGARIRMGRLEDLRWCVLQLHTPATLWLLGKSDVRSLPRRHQGP